ncbi:MAG: type II toxin-antitoxin system HicB family antitoxin [Geothrix sp.]|nr:type II toxin-antitoxin system HicB family antitoxin [Geothrix sp.]
MRNYIAILRKDTDSDYRVNFPDFPGCITAGISLEEAKEKVLEALPFHVEVLQEDGREIPEPMSLDDAMRHDCAAGAQAFFLIEIPWNDPIVRANITIPRGMLERVDRYAKAHHLSRSAFLAQAAQRAMAGNPLQ